MNSGEGLEYGERMGVLGMISLEEIKNRSDLVDLNRHQIRDFVMPMESLIVVTQHLHVEVGRHRIHSQYISSPFVIVRTFRNACIATKVEPTRT